MSDIVIKAESISKQYILDKYGRYYSIRDYISETPQRIFHQVSRRAKTKSFWALKNISFKVERGEVLGVIGRNGAGKSTLLKILSRIMPPTRGRATIHGRVASMLEIGTGFNSELTGRENIYLNGAILGMKRKEINSKFDQIVEFSEIGQFIDVPVKKYSSGMYVRLAFSVAAHLDPEIVLLDEVLAVGDLPFQRKSLKKMKSIAKDEGRTVIFVSHNLSSVDSLCNKALLLEKGRVTAYGKTREVITKYVTGFMPKKTPISKMTSREGTGKIKLMDFWIEDQNHKKTAFVRSGDHCFFVFKYACPKKIKGETVDGGFTIFSVLDQPLFSHYLSYTRQEIRNLPVKGTLFFEFPKFPLARGEYKIGISLATNGITADIIPFAAQMSVQDGDFYRPNVTLDQSNPPFFIDGKWITG
ncbi:ABC transporter ATP-binding protein [Patescibacteria group bacterium]|nr:ABC transporter ATP-binding protein [Patescibacteria group bacterium]